MNKSSLPVACALIGCFAVASITLADSQPAATTVTSLDGQWMLATDPQNVGREQKWFEKESVEGANPARVPWIIQATFPAYHGVAWYWRSFNAPANPHAGGRYLLRFWQVDYLAEVWLNGTKVGGHEGGETPFLLDVTAAVKPGHTNRLAVRVLNPTNEPIDGIRLAETAKRCKEGGAKFSAGGSYNHGGITENVELLCVPAVYLDDLFATAMPSATSGRIHVQIGVCNTTAAAQKATFVVTVASARSGETTAVVQLDRTIPAGGSTIDADLTIDHPHLWDLNDPHLYRVTARASADAARSAAERSVRCGFREFCFRDGYFRLNGRRIYPRSTHTCNHFPIGQQFAHDPDLLRRDLLNLKVMGFNMVRFIWGAATPVQLDLCDEIGLMVYEESYASWPIVDSPKMAERFDAAVSELIRRDRNHPSVVTWGLLNETNDGATFRHAAAMLPLIRSLDRDRMVLLNSGRWDEHPYRQGLWKVPGMAIWPVAPLGEPWVAKNTTARTVRELSITWPAGRLALHPGPANQFSVVRWTAPAASQVQLSAAFTGFASRATTDVHVLHRGHALFDGAINLRGSSNEARFDKSLAVAQGDTLDFVVGTGNGNYGGDTTGLAVTIKTVQKTYEAAAEFSTQANPNGAWSYGQLLPASAPDAAKFVAYGSDVPRQVDAGSLANPGSNVWNDLVSDQHDYPRVPCTAATIERLRTRTGDRGQPLFLSEYGIGSAVDLWRATRHFEQHGAEGLEDAQYLRDKLDRFEADWKNWRLDEIYARPEDFFMESLKKMAGQRTLCLNAIRSNPNIVGHSLTGAIDHVMCGEGLTTLFRELKPGTIDALFDGWYPLRWCLFAEPVHVARGAKIRLDAVLANEDVLKPGDYPARLQVIGPNVTRILDRRITVTIPPRKAGSEPPLAQTCFSGEVAIDGPTGKYQLLATFERRAAAAGGTIEFHVTDPAEMPPVDTDVVLWGDDPPLAQWFSAHGIRTHPFPSLPSAADGVKTGHPEVILASSKPPAPGGKAAFDVLSKRIAAGATAVFLDPQVFAAVDAPTAFLPLEHKGTLATIRGWLYLKDEWAKRHPIFDGMPAGGLMDYNYYRELIPDLVWQGQDPPAEAVAGAIKASQDYASGLMIAVYPLGKGRLVLNTLKIRENLETHPAAQRLLRNMLRYAAMPSKTAPAK
jgi:hypothetical protein